MDKFWSAPPVSRTLVAAMFFESALCHGGLIDIRLILFHLPWIFKLPLPELWRFVTPFLLTGSGFSFIFDLYFMWTYGTGLELNSPRFAQPGDFFTFVVFVSTVILATSGFLLRNFIFTSALILAFIYTYAQENRGKKAHFIIVQIPVEYLPWAMLSFSLIMGGPRAAMAEGTGLVAAHLYDFLTRLYPIFQGGRNWIQTPMAIRRAFGADKAQFSHKTYGTSYSPGQPTPSARSSGWTSALGGSWGSRGAGRRLGGD